MLASIVAATILWTAPAQAQVAIAKQPVAADWYAEASGLLAHGRVPESALPTLPASPVDASLVKDWTRLDWLEAGDYNYGTSSFDVTYTATKPSQIDIRRYQDDGGELRFQYSAPAATVTAGKIRQLNFQNPPVSKTTVVTTNGVTWLKTVAYGETEMQRVVSYAGGVLVVDLSKDGKATSKAALRAVYVPMPRRFEWSF